MTLLQNLPSHEDLASPNSILVPGMKNIGLGMSAAVVSVRLSSYSRWENAPYPLDIPRFITITCLLFHACRTGIPEIGESGSSELGLTVSLAPITSVTSVSGKSSLISSISSTTARLVESVGWGGCLTIVWDGRLGQEHVALAWHSSGDGVDRETDVDASGAQSADDLG